MEQLVQSIGMTASTFSLRARLHVVPWHANQPIIISVFRRSFASHFRNVDVIISTSRTCAPNCTAARMLYQTCRGATRTALATRWCAPQKLGRHTIREYTARSSFSRRRCAQELTHSAVLVGFAAVAAHESLSSADTDDAQGNDRVKEFQSCVKPTMRCFHVQYSIIHSR